MVADTYSARLGMLEMGTGNQNNSWGTSFNGSVTNVIDRAIAGVAAYSNTGGTLDLSASPPPAGLRQDLDAVQLFNGALTSDLTVIVPNLSKIWDVGNFTSGSFSLFFKTASGTAVQIPQGCIRKLILDGSNNIFREDRDEVGKFTYTARAAVAPGELLCNGASLLRASFPDLFNAIGITWGAVDGTHFTLPLLTDTGRYLRSAGGGFAVGGYLANQNKSHTHTGGGTDSTVGIDHTHPVAGTTSTESATHTHTYNNSNAASAGVTGGGGFGLNINDSGGTTGAQSANHTHSFSVTSGTMNSNTSHSHTYSFTTSTGSADGTEARPESAVVLICIKY